MSASRLRRAVAVILAIGLLFVCGCHKNDTGVTVSDTVSSGLPNGRIESSDILSSRPHTVSEAAGKTVVIPEYSGRIYAVINNNIPEFSDSELTEKSFESYSELDRLGRCGPATASVGKDIMPTEKRSEIGMIKPSGWQTVKYDFVDGKYLYNRCHLIGFQLTGENANEKNLITGTRYFNTVGMLPFENMVADYVKETGNHVAYRVTPMFSGSDLVAKGVQMEAFSVEDNGDGICFNIFCYNVQPGVYINYSTGVSRIDEEAASKAPSSDAPTYIVNINSKKFHLPDCESVGKMKAENRAEVHATRDELIAQGYAPCGSCHP